jgi:glycerol-3-phosphate acyltransferase PlsY
MSDLEKDGQETTDTAPDKGAGKLPGGAGPALRNVRMQLPGLMAIGLYMFLLAGVTVLGVVTGHYPPLFLIFSAAFIAAGLGVLFLLRWAWAMTLAAMALLTGLFLWQFTTQHSIPYIVQGLLNLLFFLYLVRPEVRQRLR